MPINASSLLVGTERRRARRTYVATLHAKIPTSIQLTGFAIEVDPSPIWNWPHVRFGSKADICSAIRHVRFTPNSDRKSGFPHRVLSALPPKADMCGALGHVCYGPKADICSYSLDGWSIAS